MTDITLPRSVVEKALKALYEADSLMEHHTNIELRRSALVELRAALEQPQGEQEPAIYPEEAFDMGLEAIPYYTHPQNLRCKSTQARLATLWGYERPQPPRQPLTDEAEHQCPYPKANPSTRNAWLDGWEAAERAHGIGGEV